MVNNNRPPRPWLLHLLIQNILWTFTPIIVKASRSNKTIKSGEQNTPGNLCPLEILYKSETS